MEKNQLRSGFMAVVRGDAQEDLLDLQTEIREDIARLEAERAGLQAGNRELITGVLENLLQADADEVPGAFDISQLVPTDGIEHMHTPLLQTSVKARIPVWLHGEAGSGKSTAAERVADRENIDFRSISLCPTTSKSDLLGYRDANGQYRRTAFRDIYEHGGVFLFDEIDNAHPSSLALINHALANGIAEFPDTQIERHPDAIMVAAANTLGKGANAQYVGRAVIDAATRDRFVYIPWNIDEAMEERIVIPTSRVKSESIKLGEGGVPSAKKWLQTVRENREAVNELGIRHLCSPRAVIYGVKLAHYGMGERWLKELCLYKGMPETDRAKIDAHIARQSAPAALLGRLSLRNDEKAMV